MKRRAKRMITCKYCGKKVTAKNYNQVFCESQCRNNFHNDLRAEAWEEYMKAKAAKDVA